MSLSPYGVWKTHRSVRGSTAANYCSPAGSAPPYIPPHESASGKCQSEDAGLCNLLEVKPSASDSLRFLTQHIGQLCRTSSLNSDEAQRAMLEDGRELFGELKAGFFYLNFATSYSNCHSSAGLLYFKTWQHTLPRPIFTSPMVFEHILAIGFAISTNHTETLLTYSAAMRGNIC